MSISSTHATLGSLASVSKKTEKKKTISSPHTPAQKKKKSPKACSTCINVKNNSRYVYVIKELLVGLLLFWSTLLYTGSSPQYDMIVPILIQLGPRRPAICIKLLHATAEISKCCKVKQSTPRGVNQSVRAVTRHTPRRRVFFSFGIHFTPATYHPLQTTMGKQKHFFLRVLQQHTRRHAFRLPGSLLVSV